VLYRICLPPISKILSNTLLRMNDAGCVLRALIRVGSWLTIGCAFLLLGTALFASWAVNDEAFGRYDLGLAIFMASVKVVTVVTDLYSAPVLVI